MTRWRLVVQAGCLVVIRQAQRLWWFVDVDDIDADRCVPYEPWDPDTPETG